MQKFVQSGRVVSRDALRFTSNGTNTRCAGIGEGGTACAMAERLGSRKRKSEPPRASRKLEFPELLPALDPNGDSPSEPDLVVQPPVKSTLLPPPAEPLVEASLESLFRALRRAL